MAIINAYDIQPIKFIKLTMNHSWNPFLPIPHTLFLSHHTAFPIYTPLHHTCKPFTQFPITPFIIILHHTRFFG